MNSESVRQCRPVRDARFGLPKDFVILPGPVENRLTEGLRYAPLVRAQPDRLNAIMARSKRRDYFNSRPREKFHRADRD